MKTPLTADIESPGACSTLDGAMNGVAGTLPRELTSAASRIAGALRDASQRHEWQMLPPTAPLDHEFAHRAGTSSDEGVRLRTL